MAQDTKKRTERSGLGLPLLIGAAFSLTFCFFSVTEVFATNRAELLFNFRDFLFWILLAAFCGTIIVAALIWIPGKKTGRIVGAVFVWMTVMGYVQSTFLNGGAGLAGDDREAFELGAPAVINFIIWIAALAAAVALAFRLKEETLRTVVTVAMIAVIGMQAAGFIANLPNLTRDRFDMAAEQEEGETNDMLIAASYLSTNGRAETASKSNVYVLILDRLDVYYVNNILRGDKDFFEPMTGFTYYGDNLSLYSRTFPGAATIIAGQDGDLTVSNETFFRTVYGTSPLLKDLKDNGYRIKLYAPSYYAYRSGRSLYGIADNMASYTGYQVTRPGDLAATLLLLSLYKALPTLFKPAVAISTQSFDDYVSYDTSAPLAGMDDYDFYQELINGGLTDGGYENAYTYLHLAGGHDPYEIDENVQKVEKGSSTGQIKGDFRILYELFDQLKKKGLYEQATIIITGDHPRAHSDSKIPEESRVTALFVKEAGRSDEPFAVSTAQVSQENLAATIIKSAGITTTYDYGLAYSEVPEGVDRVRYHQFQLYTGNGNRILRYRVEGPAEDFNNWTLESDTEIGRLYK